MTKHAVNPRACGVDRLYYSHKCSQLVNPRACGVDKLEAALVLNDRG